MGDLVLKWNRTKNIKLCQSRLLPPYQNQNTDTRIRSNHLNNPKYPLSLFYSTELLHNTNLGKYEENDVWCKKKYVQTFHQIQLCLKGGNKVQQENMNQAGSSTFSLVFNINQAGCSILNLVFSVLISSDQTEMFHSGAGRAILPLWYTKQTEHYAICQTFLSIPGIFLALTVLALIKWMILVNGAGTVTIWNVKAQTPPTKTSGYKYT